jgi:hypothetical protein
MDEEWSVPQEELIKAGEVKYMNIFKNVSNFLCDVVVESEIK